MGTIKHLRIAGRVQGVGFRYFVERKANELGVTGWVRNRHDGSVEAMVQGTPEAVEAMIAAARQGPRAAIVTDVQVSEGSGEFHRVLLAPDGVIR
jgi:acylphosphatase